MTGKNSLTGTAPSPTASPTKSFSFLDYFRSSSPPPSPKNTVSSKQIEEEKEAKFHAMTFDQLDTLKNQYSKDFSDIMRQALPLQEKNPNKYLELRRVADQLETRHGRIELFWSSRKRELQQQSLSTTESDTSAPTSPSSTVTASMPPGGLSLNTSRPTPK